MAKTEHTLRQFLELPDYLTLLGGVFGVLGALAAIDHRFTLAACLLLLSVPCDYFDGKRKNFDLELDMKGTDFQKKVWDYCETHC